MAIKKQDTKLESEGAEFLVLGLLLVEGIPTYKAYINFPGYDLTCVNPNTKKVAKIQVKSRWATDYDKSFPLKNLDCDFVVHVALNRGFRFGKKNNTKDVQVKDPEFYVFPIETVEKVRQSDKWLKVPINKIDNLEEYKNNWGLIKKFLQD